jgi:hypothetical protein
MSTKRFSPRQNFCKRNIEKVPEDKPIVYKILNKQGDNVYTGVSKRGQGQDRLRDHLSGGSDPIAGATSFQTKQIPSIERARGEERKIIKIEEPKYNKSP